MHLGRMSSLSGQAQAILATKAHQSIPEETADQEHHDHFEVPPAPRNNVAVSPFNSASVDGNECGFLANWAMNKSPSSNLLKPKETSYSPDDPGGQIQVTAYGRSYNFDPKEVNTIAAVEESLRKELRVIPVHPGVYAENNSAQAFELLDVYGRDVITDGDFREVVRDGRMPLVANLHVPPVNHNLESHREELSHLQWKLIRDQICGLAEKVTQLSKRIQEVGEALIIHKRDQAINIDRIRDDSVAFADANKEYARQNAIQVSERIDAVSQLINSERSCREASKQGFERQFQAIRDIFESEMSASRSESNSTAALIHDLRQTFASEVAKHDSMEERIEQHCENLTERIETLERQYAEQSLELSEQVKRSDQRTAEVFDFMTGSLNYPVAISKGAAMRNAEVDNKFRLPTGQSELEQVNTKRSITEESTATVPPQQPSTKSPFGSELTSLASSSMQPMAATAAMVAPPPAAPTVYNVGSPPSQHCRLSRSPSPIVSRVLRSPSGSTVKGVNHKPEEVRNVTRGSAGIVYGSKVQVLRDVFEPHASSGSRSPLRGRGRFSPGAPSPPIRFPLLPVTLDSNVAKVTTYSYDANAVPRDGRMSPSTMSTTTTLSPFTSLAGSVAMSHSTPVIGSSIEIRV